MQSIPIDFQIIINYLYKKYEDIINYKRKENKMNYLYVIIPILVSFLVGIRIIRTTQRGLTERLGKYQSFA
jgi:hypothetical protein